MSSHSELITTVISLDPHEGGHEHDKFMGMVAKFSSGKAEAVNGPASGDVDVMSFCLPHCLSRLNTTEAPEQLKISIFRQISDLADQSLESHEILTDKSLSNQDIRTSSAIPKKVVLVTLDVHDNHPTAGHSTRSASTGDRYEGIVEDGGKLSLTIPHGISRESSDQIPFPNLLVYIETPEVSTKVNPAEKLKGRASAVQTEATKIATEPVIEAATESSTKRGRKPKTTEELKPKKKDSETTSSPQPIKITRGRKKDEQPEEVVVDAPHDKKTKRTK